MLKNLTPKKLFLIDGMGAVLTALLLSQLLARLIPVFGMPRAILYPLAGIAACFAAYSFTCHLLIKQNWAPFLRGIAVANTLYCLTTLGCVIYLWDSLTWLGIAYFIGEILIVMTLVRAEIKMSQKNYMA
jgi:hypothetical protein